MLAVQTATQEIIPKNKGILWGQEFAQTKEEKQERKNLKNEWMKGRKKKKNKKTESR